MLDMIDEFEDFRRSFAYTSNDINEFMEVVFRKSEMS